jgi:hypothetical protein
MASKIVQHVNKSIGGDKDGRLLRRRLAELGHDTFRQTLDNHLKNKTSESPKVPLLLALMEVAERFGAIPAKEFLAFVRAEVFGKQQ